MERDIQVHYCAEEFENDRSLASPSRATARGNGRLNTSEHQRWQENFSRLA